MKKTLSGLTRFVPMLHNTLMVKRTVFLLILLMLIPTLCFSVNKSRWRSEVTGANSLSEIDGSILVDGDPAFVIRNSSGTYEGYTYKLQDVDPPPATSIPLVVTPSSNAGNKRWLLVETVTRGINLPEVTAPGAGSANTLRIYNFSELYSGFSDLLSVDSTGLIRGLTRDSVITVYNGSGTTIAKGKAVYLYLTQNGFPNVLPARADSVDYLPVIGLTMEAISDSGYGRVMQIGRYEGFDTTAIVNASEGCVIYVSATVDGGLTCTAPSLPNVRQRLGTVLTTGASGVISVFIRHMTVADLGTVYNTWQLGDGNYGAKDVIFNGEVTGTLRWTPMNTTKVMTIPDETGTICSTGSVCTGYQPIDSGSVASVTCTSTGADLVEGALTITPTTTYVEITNLDPDGCEITMGETGIGKGTKVFLVNLSTPYCAFVDTSGVTEINGRYEMGQWQSFMLMYTTDRWIELGRSAN